MKGGAPEQRRRGASPVRLAPNFVVHQFAAAWLRVHQISPHVIVRPDAGDIVPEFAEGGAFAAVARKHRTLRQRAARTRAVTLHGGARASAQAGGSRIHAAPVGDDGGSGPEARKSRYLRAANAD
ncbi:hypothetical protein PT2222_70266 [Paraburkholderia tropica]